MVQSTNTNDTHQGHIHLQVQTDHKQMVQKNEANLGESELYNDMVLIFWLLRSKEVEEIEILTSYYQKDCSLTSTSLTGV